MFTRIVVPLDGSALAEQALAVAEDLARRAGAPLHLVRVVDVTRLDRYGPHVVRSFDLGKDVARKDQRLAEEAPLLAVLGTATDSPPRWLAAGQALARILLRARAAGVDASFLNQPVQVTELRFRLAETVGRTAGFPQLVLRMGYGPAVKPAPRRPVDDVLVTDEAGDGEGGGAEAIL
jgi:nucleotide-binding universal stress UspA family protein